MKKFGITIFISSFLLFLVQPMIARFILPWYGGSAAVWSACLLFFQAGLLLGYGYSHLLAKKFSVSTQVKIHLALLILSLISMPIIPKDSLRPEAFDNPVTGILYLLSLTLGFPYIMVSSTAPLMQHWFSISNPQKSPYRLYALSNLASLTGLLSYPLLFEPLLNLHSQAWLWSVGYLFFIIFSVLIAKSIFKLKPLIKKMQEKPSPAVNASTKILWLLLAFFGTTTLLSCTNKLTQDTVVIPFLWILPLTIYLITFIIAFEKIRWYKRQIIIPLAIFTIAIFIYTLVRNLTPGYSPSIFSIVIQFNLVVFMTCMILHGELAHIRPVEKHLTLFYFMISLGGVLGGIFVNIIAPQIFKSFYEIYFALGGSVLVLGLYFYFTKKAIKVNKPIVVTVSFLLLFMIYYGMRAEMIDFSDNHIASARNFYGVIKVTEENNGSGNAQRSFIYGSTLHGVEIMDSSKSNIPFTYYVPQSGIGVTLSYFQKQTDSTNRGIRVGIIGLGTGTISAYGSKNDYYKYYELNPQVEVFAKKYFKYLSNFKGNEEVVIGDGRKSLEKELKEKGSNKFDVMVVDAFSDDLIPAHLLTEEAVSLYLNHMNKDGVLAFHITNTYIDLMPVLGGIGSKFNLPMYYVIKQADANNPVASLWVLFTLNKKFISDPDVIPYLQPYDVNNNPVVYWTDDHTSILPLIRK